MAGKWVNDAFGFMASWNFFLYEALAIPFEITALPMVLSFWKDDIPKGAVCGVCIAAFGGKALLIAMLFSFTLISMVGGNPQNDAYRFRYWRGPGPMVEYLHTDSLGRFEGVLAALWTASFTIADPEYGNLLAAEAKRPRVYVKNAFISFFTWHSTPW
ncbi:hypothetical protein BBP40_011502 [Aspergillus hancockii]|nr:hypothetical protein BBP40_011502 [Aspergillus hancockii]